MGEDLAGARIAGRRRLSRQGRPADVPRQARLQPRRLRLHHLHRQLRPAARRRSRRRSTRTASSPPPCSPATATSKAASAPTCRRTTSPRRRSSSPTRSPARCRRTSTTEPLGTGSDGKPVYLKDIWPTRTRKSRTSSPRTSRASCSIDRYADVFKGDANWQGDRHRQRPDLRLGRHVHLRAEPALLRGHQPRRPTAITDIDGARILGLFGDKITTDHISPAGSIKAVVARRQVPARARRRRRRLQPVRHAPRQPRSDDARHLRQHPHQELHGQGCRRQRQGGRLHGPLSVRRADVDLRRRHAVQGRGRAAGRLRRHRIRQRLVARLGGQGHQPARRRAVIAQSSSASTARTSSAWASCRSCSRKARRWQTLGLKGDETVTIRGPRRRQAAPDDDRRDHRRRRHGRARCRSSAASIRSTSSSTSRTAASCTTCCATWRRRPELQSHHGRLDPGVTIFREFCCSVTPRSLVLWGVPFRCILRACGWLPHCIDRSHFSCRLPAR